VGLLVAVVALAVDGGTLMEERRHVQAAADAAALAAAADLFAHYSAYQGVDTLGTAAASALATAGANGYSNDGVQSIVTVNVSPQTYQAGPNAGKVLPAGYAEVIIQSNVGRTFSNIFGSGNIPVKARAVARGRWVQVGSQVISLNNTASSAVSVSGSASLNINGGLLVNSSSSSAIDVTSSASLSASTVTLNSGGGGILGNLLSAVLGLLGLGGGSPPPPVTYAPPVADPLRSLPAPDPVQLNLPLQGTNLNIAGGTRELYPGVYNGGITISQGASVTLHANADGTPGIYFLQGGGLITSGPSSLTMVAGETAGVMIYNDWQTSTDAIKLGGKSSLVLSPPTSGSYQGVTIFQKRGTLANPAPDLSIVGVGKANISGTIYAAYADVTLTGVSGTNLMGGQIIADTVTASGAAKANVDPGSSPVAKSRVLGLVE
jgi:Flp pilus assembly protein TadG